MAPLEIFEDAIAEIAARLDLREPNRDATDQARNQNCSSDTQVSGGSRYRILCAP